MEPWNDRIPLAGVISKVLVCALAALRKLGWRWYRMVRLHDCVRYMKARHGEDWVSKEFVDRMNLGADNLIGLMV